MPDPASMEDFFDKPKSLGPLVCLLYHIIVRPTQNAEWPSSGHGNIIADIAGTEGPSLLLSLHPWVHQVGWVACPTGRGCLKSRNAAFLLPQDSWSASKSCCLLRSNAELGTWVTPCKSSEICQHLYWPWGKVGSWSHRQKLSWVRDA